jgi:hypothetical protein
MVWVEKTRSSLLLESKWANTTLLIVPSAPGSINAALASALLLNDQRKRLAAM